MFFGTFAWEKIAKKDFYPCFSLVGMLFKIRVYNNIPIAFCAKTLIWFSIIMGYLFLDSFNILHLSCDPHAKVNYQT